MSKMVLIDVKSSQESPHVIKKNIHPLVRPRIYFIENIHVFLIRMNLPYFPYESDLEKYQHSIYVVRIAYILQLRPK